MYIIYDGKRKYYDLFISHAWDYKDEYYRLRDLLKNRRYFYWRDYSVPFHDPINSTNAYTIKRKIEEQIRQSSVFIILAGMYATYSDWIDYEIDVAKRQNKPILAIKPWGRQLMPIKVKNAAKEIVGWNTESIVNAIRRLA